MTEQIITFAKMYLCFILQKYTVPEDWMYKVGKIICSQFKHYYSSCTSNKDLASLAALMSDITLFPHRYIGMLFIET